MPQPTTQRSAFAEFLRMFYMDPRGHSNFYWVLATRLPGNMGVWSAFTFLLFYFKDVIGVAEPAQVLPALLGIGAVLAVPASIIGIRLAARYGLVRNDPRALPDSEEPYFIPAWRQISPKCLSPRSRS